MKGAFTGATQDRAGKFRSDLYHRLNVNPIRVPPLRERKENIPLLAGFFLDRTGRRLGLGEIRISPAAPQLLARYSWLGNVRELENIISRAVLKASQRTGLPGGLQIEPEHLAGDIDSAMYVQPAEMTVAARSVSERISLREEVRLFDIQHIQDALAKLGGSWAAAARELGMNRSNLHNPAAWFGIRNREI